MSIEKQQRREAAPRSTSTQDVHADNDAQMNRKSGRKGRGEELRNLPLRGEREFKDDRIDESALSRHVIVKVVAVVDRRKHGRGQAWTRRWTRWRQEPL